MDKMISFCGLDCIDCPVYKATQNDDDKERDKVAGSWTKLFNYQFKREDINCDGCLSSNGRIFGHCNTCGIRRCGQEKGIENCAHCGDYPCRQLSELHKVIPNPSAPRNLEEIRKNL